MCVVAAPEDMGSARLIAEHFGSPKAPLPLVEASPAGSRKKLLLPAQSPRYYFVISPNLMSRQREIRYVMDHHPERAYPVELQPCTASLIHPRLDFMELIRWPTPTAGLRPRAFPMPILMFLSMKGGVGKTASAVATAECLAEAGNRVLVIDTDHQCGASSLLLGDDAIEKLEESRKTLADMFLSMLTTEFNESTEKSLERFIVGRASNITEVAPYLHIIPGSLRLEDFWTRLSPKNRATHSPDEWAKIFYNQHAPKFRKWLLRNFDVVIIDCPPTIAWQVRFFLRVADGFIIPSIPDRLSVRGVLYLQQRLHNLHMTRIQPLGTLWTMVRGNVVSHQNMMQGHATLFPDARPLPEPFTTSIPNTASFITVTTPDLTFTTYAQKYGTELAPRYRTFCKDLLERTRHLRNQPASLVAQTETAP